VILGTAAYMSPEQARGRSVDKRADLWAFGCLLYEMLTRRKCFEGETISDTLASVLKEQPDWSRLPDDTPPAIRRLLRRCLAKDPRRRLSDAADARLELDEALEPPRPEEHPAAAMDGAPPRTGIGTWLPWAVASLAVVAVVGAWLIGGRAQPPLPAEPLELSILIPPDVRLTDDQVTMLELSPDGRYVVFSGTGTDARSSTLYLRDLRDSTVVELPGTERAQNPMFSPDGRWIGFFADGHIKKIPIDGGTPVPICEMTGSPRGASWGGDDLIVYPEHFIGGLVQVPGSGGRPEPLTELDADRKERTHRWPQIVPGHDVVLFTVATTDSPEFYDDARIDALRLTTGERKTVFEGGSFARYVPSGHLVVGRGGFLFAVPFDITRLETTGRPTPVLEGVRGTPNSGVVHASIAQNGLLAYVAGEPENPTRQVTWFHLDGREEPLDIEPGRYRDPTISPDGKSVALTVARDRSSDIWVFGLESETRTRLTFEHENSLPIWTPDGKSVVFYSMRDGSGAAYITAADGSGGERLLHAGRAGTSSSPQDISADGRLLLLQTDGDNKQDLWVKSLVDPEAEAIPFLAGPSDETIGRFSPDGRWIAYSSDETGDYQVFVRPYPGPGGRWQISSDGGARPQWSPDGRQLHYRVNRAWWVVDVESGDGQSFRAGAPRLVRDDLQRVSLSLTHGMSQDGQAMLVAVSDETRAAPGEITVVVDWLSALER
jgi:serine/threonine-protein kinase